MYQILKGLLMVAPQNDSRDYTNCIRVNSRSLGAANRHMALIVDHRVHTHRKSEDPVHVCSADLADKLREFDAESGVELCIDGSDLPYLTAPPNIKRVYVKRCQGFPASVSVNGPCGFDVNLVAKMCRAIRTILGSNVWLCEFDASENIIKIVGKGVQGFVSPSLPKE